ncbi:MAG: amidohydrolase family protein [Phycisphaerae bacterium]|nr:amidohydrolase family protein [Phycisphaerae bacterium]
MEKVRASNLIGLDYRAEAGRMSRFAHGIIDVHTHINGDRAAAIYQEARELFGVRLTYSMTQMMHAESVKRVLGDSVRFIATPNFGETDRSRAFGEGFIEAIDRWYDLGARMVKFWSAPRGRDIGREAGDWRIVTLHNPLRRKQMDHAAAKGMMFMVHVADPDTWFKTKYSDASRYGTKREQYEPLEVLGSEYPRVPWILAHMGGWPENLDFLDGLLTRHPNFYLDTSATKWMVRELSKHPSDRMLEFHTKWSGRILFGSDIVTSEAHVGGAYTGGPPTGESSTPEEAFDLYASRYWALRMQYESRHEGRSPIADPDLMMVEPGKYDEAASPMLRGHGLPGELLRVMYHDAARELLERFYGEFRMPRA